jgi:hypothetical protein
MIEKSFTQKFDRHESRRYLMFKIRISLTGFACLFFFAVLFSASQNAFSTTMGVAIPTPTPAPTLVAPVRVTNTADQPVPVTGTITGDVTVNGTPNVTVANTPNVIVANTASVTVANTPNVGIDPIKNVVRDPTVAGKLDSANDSLGNIATAANKLVFDGSGNLKTTPQGTQNVNVVGGTISATTRVADKATGSYNWNLGADSSSSRVDINLKATMMSIQTSGNITIQLVVNDGYQFLLYVPGGLTQIVFPVPVALSAYYVINDDTVFGRSGRISVLGY